MKNQEETMSKLLRRIFLPVLCAVTAVCCIFGIAACKKKPKPDGQTYTVIIQQTEHGTVTADCESAAAGATVTLTVTPDDNYYLDVLTVNGVATQVSGGKAEFTMPASNVTVSAEFVANGEYAVRLGNFENMSVKADKTSAEEGEKVNLTVSVNYGYQLVELKMNGAALTVAGGKAEFTMPASAAEITASATLVANAKQGAAVKNFELSSKIMNDTATSYWSTVYGADALEVSVYVQDAKVSAAKDAVEFYVGRFGFEYTKLTAVNFGVKVFADGTDVQYAVSDGEYVSADEDAFTVTEAVPWTEDGANVSGYFVKVSLPYAKLGFAGAPQDGEITLLPVLNNYTNAIGGSASYFGASINNPAEYPVLKGGVLKENYYAQGIGMLGGTASIPASKGWDLSKDYSPQDTENYPNRQVVLNATTPDDDLLFFRNEGKNVYAEATFRANGVKNNEKLGKFGLMLFDGASKNGVFFYVEADANGSSVSSITGNGLGYTLTNNSNFTWGHDHVVTNVYRYDRDITLKMAYVEERGYVYVYYTAENGEDVLVESIRYKAGHDVTIGFKSFNIDLTVTNYGCTNDTENAEFAAHIPAPRFMGNNLGGTEDNADFGSKWDISKDYAGDAPNYADREVRLTGHDGADNNIYFIATEGKAAYVRATFRADEVLNSEKWGKFGFMLFDGVREGKRDKGAFFYVDAFVGDSADGVIRGRQLGYNYAPNGYGGWNTLNKAGDVFNLDTKTITLAMSYKNSVLSMYYENAEGQDVLVNQLVYSATSDKFIIGIKSFAIALTVTDYKAVTDPNDAEFAAHAPVIVKKDIDVLFAGDSYMEFWKNYGVWDNLTADLTSAGKKLENVGVGGTQVPYWDNGGMTGALQMQFNTKKIVFHIGVNDIDGLVSVNDTYDRLVSLFANYHSAFPAAEIYWVCCIPNNFYINNGGTYNASYKQLNVKVKDLSASTDYLTYIDVETPFTDENGNARTNLFMSDGLHLNPVYGYPLWTSVIKEAIGYPASATGAQLGDLSGENIQRKATSGWSYGTNGNLAEICTDVVMDKTVKTEEAVYYKDLYGADILFEANIRSSDRFFADNASKPGVMLVNDNFTLFAYLATYADEWQNNGKTVSWYGLLYRNNVQNNDGKPVGVADWNWETLSQYDKQIPTINICDDYHKLGIAKLGATIYLLLDGNVVRECTVPGVTADMKFSAGVMTFNRYMEVNGVNAVSGAQDVELALATPHTVSVPSYEGVTITPNKTSAKKTEIVTFTVNAGGSVIDKVYVTYGGTDRELTATDGVYSFTMPDENVAIKITFLGKMSVTLATDIADKISASSLSVTQGHTVTFTAKSGYAIGKLYAETASGGKTEIVPVDGVYTFTVNEDVTITGECYRYEYGMIFDGKLTAEEGWTGDVYNKTAVFNANGALLVMRGFTTQEGIRMSFEIKHNQPHTSKLQQMNEGDEWHRFLNLEIRLNNNKLGDILIQAGVFNNYAVNCLSAWSSVNNTDGDKNNYKYKTTFELFVNHSTVGSNPGEPVSIALGGVFENGFKWLSFGDNVLRWTHEFTAQGVNTIDNLYKEYDVANSPAVLDGEFNDSVWTKTVKDNTFTTATSYLGTGVDFSVMGVKADKGALLGITVIHKVAVDQRCQGNDDKAFANWFYYMGPEIRLGGKVNQICVNALGYTQWCWSGIKTVTNADGSYTTTFEVYIPYAPLGIDASGNLELALGGVYETGFTTLFGSVWNNDAVVYNPFLVTENGLVTGEGFAQQYLTAGLSEAVWNNAGEPLVAENAGVKISTKGVKVSNGIYLAVTIGHNRSVYDLLGTDANNFADYQNIQLSLNGVDNDGAFTHAVAAYNNGTIGCKFGRITAVNAADSAYKYTTTYKIFIETDTSSDVGLTMVVRADGFNGGVYGSTVWNAPAFTCTANGLVTV